jgi:hypothetical protein
MVEAERKEATQPIVDVGCGKQFVAHLRRETGQVGGGFDGFLPKKHSRASN